MFFDGRSCQIKSKIPPFIFIFERGTCLYMSGLCFACQTDRWIDGQIKSDISMCADGTHLLWPPRAPFEFHWIPVYFGTLQSFLPGTSRICSNQNFDWIYFIHGPPRGNIFLYSVLAGAMLGAVRRKGSSEVLKSGLFWQVLMCWGLNHWHCKTKTPDH